MGTIPVDEEGSKTVSVAIPFKFYEPTGNPVCRYLSGAVSLFFTSTDREASVCQPLRRAALQ